MHLPFTPLVPLISLCTMYIVEYSTLTSRKRLCAHLCARVLSVLLCLSSYLLLLHIGIRTYPLIYTPCLFLLAASFYLFDEPAPSKVFLFFMAWGITTFLSVLCLWMTALVIPRPDRAPIWIAIYGTLCSTAVVLYLSFWRRRVREVLALFKRGNPVYALFPVSAFAYFVYAFGPLTSATSLSRFVEMLLCWALISFTYYLIFAHFYSIEESRRVEDGLVAAERQIVLQKKYYAEVDANYERQRKLIHDNRHHYVVVASLARSGDYAALLEYVEGYLENSGGSPVRRFCANKMANAIISGYAEMATQKGIATQFELELSDGIGIDPYDLCIFFGNTIENAIEACERIPEASALRSRRFISVKSREEAGRLVIRMENSFQAEGTPAYGAFPSSKGSLGGVGLESVKAMVERYGGALNLEREGEVFTLSAVLYPQVLPVPLAEPALSPGA